MGLWILDVITVLFITLQIVTALFGGYQIIFSFFGLIYRRRQVTASAEKRFAVLVAAHNEEAVISPLLLIDEGRKY